MTEEGDAVATVYSDVYTEAEAAEVAKSMEKTYGKLTLVEVTLDRDNRY